MASLQTLWDRPTTPRNAAEHYTTVARDSQTFRTVGRRKIKRSLAARERPNVPRLVLQPCFANRSEAHGWRTNRGAGGGLPECNSSAWNAAFRGPTRTWTRRRAGSARLT